MNESEALEQNRIRQTRDKRTGRKAAPSAPAARAIKLPATRKTGPAGLLAEHYSDSDAYGVCFEYYNPDAREVLVAGSFNDWQAQSSPMTKQRGGKWSTQILLKPGRYEYRLVVDGHWQDDPLAARFVANSFGGLNGVIEVKATAVSTAASP